jgi:hypothetical protein
MRTRIIGLLCVAVAVAGCAQESREERTRAEIALLDDQMSEWSRDITRLRSKLEIIRSESDGMTNKAALSHIFQRYDAKCEKLAQTRRQHDAADMKRISLMIELDRAERGPSNKQGGR